MLLIKRFINERFFLIINDEKICIELVEIENGKPTLNVHADDSWFITESKDFLQNKDRFGIYMKKDDIEIVVEAARVLQRAVIFMIEAPKKVVILREELM